MTTAAEMRKYARERFTPEMEKRGYTLAKRGLGGLFYFLKTGDVYRCVVLSLSRGNEKLLVFAFAWVPELAPQPYDWEKFPDGVTMVTGGLLSDRGPGERSTSVSEWAVGPRDESLAALDQALALVVRAALPWLDGIGTREDMARHIRKDSESDRFGNRTVDRIFGRVQILKSQL